MILHDESVVRLLERIERQARVYLQSPDHDGDAVIAFRGDIRTLSCLLKSCPDFMSPSEARELLLELRKRYLRAPSEFRSLIDQAIVDIERMADGDASAMFERGQ